VDDLQWSVSDGVGVIRLNRPDARNAFTFPMIRKWAQILREAKGDDTVRVIVLTGAGDKAFCSGVDLSSISNAHPDLTPLQRKSQLHDEIHQVALAMADLDKPVIASINGVAVGAGLDMALMCDLRIMSSAARLSEGYVKVGLTPGDGGAYYLPRIVGTSKALELLLTGTSSTPRRPCESVLSTGWQRPRSSPRRPSGSRAPSPTSRRSRCG
jgi:enoyl-CoA hydratase/carnithine racemase